MVTLLTMTNMCTLEALADDIVMVNGKRYARNGDKLYPQVDASWTDTNGVVHPSWITDYSTYEAPVTKPIVPAAETNMRATSNLRPAAGRVPQTSPVNSAAAKAPSYSVRDEGRKHLISLSADMLFDFDKSTLTPKAQAVLTELAPVLKKYGEASVIIDGHTDNIGTDEYNQDLSERRARTVKERLIALGAVTESAGIRGFGSRCPVANNTYGDGTDYPQGRAKNRRVVITVETVETASAPQAAPN